MNKPLTIFALAMFAGFISAGAQSLAAPEAVGAILESSPELQSQAMRQGAEKAALGDAARIAQQPEVEFEHLWGGGETRWNIGVTQGFDWPGVYGKRKKAARAQMDAFEYLYRARRQELATEARLLFAQGVYLNKQRVLLDSLISNIRTINDLVEYGYREGQISVLDVRKLAFESYTLSTRMTDLQAELVTVSSGLDELAGRKLGYDFGAYEPLPLLSLDEYNAAAAASPSVTALRQQADARQLQADAERAGRLPGLALGYRHAFEDNTHFNGFSVAVTLPVWKTGNARRAALMQADADRMDADALIHARELELQTTYRKVSDRSRYMADLQRVVLDDSYPQLLMMAYRGGKLTVIDYLTELDYFIEARFGYLETEYNYICDLIRLNRYTF